MHQNYPLALITFKNYVKLSIIQHYQAYCMQLMEVTDVKSIWFVSRNKIKWKS